jgi:uncharacterized protein YjbI with pentapeptide repeats
VAKTWRNHAGISMLTDLAYRRRALKPLVADASLPYWQRATIQRAVTFLRSLIKHPKPGLPLAKRIDSLARELDHLQELAAARNAHRYRLGQRGFRGNANHLKLLLASLDAPVRENEWNHWRQSRPRIVPDLRGAHLEELDLREVRLHRANLDRAGLSHASLRGSNLHHASLRSARLDEADFSYSEMRRVDLRDSINRATNFMDADLRDADLRKASLIGCVMNRARLDGADLRGALVWGSSVWDVEYDRRTRQAGLQIGWENLDPIDTSLYPRHRPGVSLTVENLEVAHFLSLVRSKPDRLADIINTASQHIVLLLGRFTGPGADVLETLRDALPPAGYAPIVFDFAVPDDRDLVETVATLAGLARFVIADLSQPRSTPLEAQLIIPNIAIPYVPIIPRGERPFAMFTSLQRKFGWVLPTVTYGSEKELARKLSRQVIAPAEKMARWLRSVKHS